MAVIFRTACMCVLPCMCLRGKQTETEKHKDQKGDEGATQCSMSRWVDPNFFRFPVLQWSKSASIAVARGWKRRKGEGLHSLWACPASTARLPGGSPSAPTVSSSLPWLTPIVPGRAHSALQPYRWYRLDEKIPAMLGSGALHSAPSCLLAACPAVPTQRQQACSVDLRSKDAAGLEDGSVRGTAVLPPSTLLGASACYRPCCALVLLCLCLWTLPG